MYILEVYFINLRGICLKRIYFDNAATSYPKPTSVLYSMLEYIKYIGSNVNRSSYGFSYEAEDILYETRQILCNMFNGDDCKNVVFTANITTSLNIILKGLLKSGDHILTSSMEHNAVMRPLSQLSLSGINYDTFPCFSDGSVDISSLSSMLKTNTKAIVITHASNVCGTLMPIFEIGRFCKENNLYFVVDSAQTAGLFPIDMQTMNIDALAFTGHKALLGPQGIGGFILKENMIKLIDPILSGGTGSISHTLDIPEFMPDRFEAGTLNIPGIYGLNASLKYIHEIGMDTILNKELTLTKNFLDELSDIKKIRVYGRSDIIDRAAVVSIDVADMDLSDIAYTLDDKYGIQTRVGLHCAPIAHSTLGTYPRGTVRFSFGHNNNSEEIKHCIQALKEIIYGI